MTAEVIDCPAKHNANGITLEQKADLSGNVFKMTGYQASKTDLPLFDSYLETTLPHSLKCQHSWTEGRGDGTGRDTDRSCRAMACTLFLFLMKF